MGATHRIVALRMLSDAELELRICAVRWIAEIPSPSR
jgi:hypothetical protein